MPAAGSIRSAASYPARTTTTTNVTGARTRRISLPADVRAATGTAAAATETPSPPPMSYGGSSSPPSQPGTPRLGPLSTPPLSTLPWASEASTPSDSPLHQTVGQPQARPPPGPTIRRVGSGNRPRAASRGERGSSTASADRPLLLAPHVRQRINEWRELVDPRNGEDGRFLGQPASPPPSPPGARAPPAYLESAPPAYLEPEWHAFRRRFLPGDEGAPREPRHAGTPAYDAPAHPARQACRAARPGSWASSISWAPGDDAAFTAVPRAARHEAAPRNAMELVRGVRHAHRYPLPPPRPLDPVQSWTERVQELLEFAGTEGGRRRAAREERGRAAREGRQRQREERGQ